jgi:hypothetical protein
MPKISQSREFTELSTEKQVRITDRKALRLAVEWKRLP